MCNFGAMAPVIRETQTIFNKVERYHNRNIGFLLTEKFMHFFLSMVGVKLD